MSFRKWVEHTTIDICTMSDSQLFILSFLGLLLSAGYYLHVSNFYLTNTGWMDLLAGIGVAIHPSLRFSQLIYVTFTWQTLDILVTSTHYSAGRSHEWRDEGCSKTVGSASPQPIGAHGPASSHPRDLGENCRQIWRKTGPLFDLCSCTKLPIDFLF